jgi:rubrerythrin
VEEESMTKKWKCTVCGYIHEGDEPPEKCPVCGASNYQFVLLEELPEALEKNLRIAFAGESKAHVRNLAFAKKADQDELPQIAKLFRAVAEAERVHAAEYLKYLEDEISDTETNLSTAFENEIKANAEIYPPLVKQAMELERDDVAGSFSRAKDVEERHAELYKDALNAMVSDEEPEYFVCQVCGYVFNRDLPDQCPVCRATRDNFKKID